LSAAAGRRDRRKTRGQARRARAGRGPPRPAADGSQSGGGALAGGGGLGHDDSEHCHNRCLMTVTTVTTDAAPPPPPRTSRPAPPAPDLARASAELGYRRATTADLAARCAVQEKALFRLWPDKRAMFLAALDQVFVESETLWERLASAPGQGSTAERLLAYEA